MHNSHAHAAAANAQSKRNNESSQNQYPVINSNDNGFAADNDFANHSIPCAYSYDPAQAAQVNANNVQVGCPPFVDYSHNHNRGPHDPYPWHYHHQSAVFAGHYDYGTPHLQPFQPQPWPQPQPQPQPQLPAIDQLGLGHSHNAGGDGSADSIVVKLCPSQGPSTSPGPGGGGGASTSTHEPCLQQRRAHSAPPHLELELELNQQRLLWQQQQQLQAARSPSSSPPPYLAPQPHGEYIPLLLSVRKLRNNETLKTLIDKEDLLIMMDYGDTNNRTNQGYPYPASTPKQTPHPPSTVADASACEGEEDDGTRTGSDSHPAAAAAAVVARPKKDLFVFHVPNDMTEGELYKLFSQFGKLRRARIHYDIIDGKPVSKGYAFVTFKRFSDAVVAVHSLHGYKVSRSERMTGLRDDAIMLYLCP